MRKISFKVIRKNLTGVINHLIYILNINSKKRKKDIFYINSSQTLPEPLSSAQEEEVFKMLLTDEKRAREILITHNLRLVVYIAKKFEACQTNIEDLVSIGSIGLIKAVKTFKPDKNIKLATYASRCIENEILMHLRKIQGQKNEFSIDEPLNVDWDGNELLLSDVMGTADDEISREFDEDVERSLLRKAVKNLPPREMEIMQMRFGLITGNEKTQKEVADIMGISQSYISRLEKRIIKKLRVDLEKIC